MRRYFIFIERSCANIVALIEYFKHPGGLKSQYHAKKLTLSQITCMNNQQLLDQTDLLSSTSKDELQLLFSYFKDELSDRSILRRLLKKGYEEPKAIEMIAEARNLYKEVVLKKKAQRDIIVGGLWFVGGTVGTLANIGFIFWGAILFGLIQCIKGIVNYSSL